MLRLPPFRHLVPGDLAEAVTAKAEYGPAASYVAGGTDLFPKMKRGQQEPQVLIQLGHLQPMHGIHQHGTHPGNGRLRLGASTTLAAVAANTTVREHWPAVARAAAGVATPAVRNMATLGGNLCLDTRCSYYDQSREWRQAIDFCLKKDGDMCRVAGSSQRCWAIQSSDLAPLMIAVGARIELEGPAGPRRVEAADFYNDDGVRYLGKQPAELVTAVRLPSAQGVATGYVKVSRRHSFDFPVLSAAVWIRRESIEAPVLEARVVLGAVGSAPLIAAEAGAVLMGRPLTKDTIEEAARAAARCSRPLENADQGASWRRKVVQPYVSRALQQLMANG